MITVYNVRSKAYTEDKVYVEQDGVFDFYGFRDAFEVCSILNLYTKQDVMYKLISATDFKKIYKE